MKAKISSENLIAIIIVALVITIFTVFSLSGNFSKITGMVTGEPTGGDVLVIFFIMFLIVMAIFMIFLAEFFIRRKNK